MLIDVFRLTRSLDLSGVVVVVANGLHKLLKPTFGVILC